MIHFTIKVINYSYRFLFMILISGITGGYSISVVANTMPKIIEQFSLSSEMSSLLAGLVFAGVVLAKLFVAYLNDKCGRRYTILIGALILILGCLEMLFAPNVIHLISGRVVQGFGGGLLMFTASIYIVEVSNDKLRGRNTAFYQFNFTLGLLLANVIGMLNLNWSWKISFVSLIAFALLLILTSYLLPCSPKWLFLKSRVNEAKVALSLNHNEQEAIDELSVWSEAQRENKTARLFEKRYVKVLFLVVLVTCLHQLIGVNAILQTSTVLFTNAGFSRGFAVEASTGLTLTNVIFTCVGLKLIEKFPRNKFLGICGLIIALDYFIIVLNYFSGFESRYVLLFGLVFFMAIYSIGPGIIIWLVFSEYLPTPIRVKGIAVAGFINSIAGFFISSLFLEISTRYGTGSLFLICAICATFYGIIPLLFLPNTTGKNIESNLFAK